MKVILSNQKSELNDEYPNYELKIAKEETRITVDAASIRKKLMWMETPAARAELTRKLEVSVERKETQRSVNALMWERVRVAEPTQIDSVIAQIEAKREILGETSYGALIRGAESKR